MQPVSKNIGKTTKTKKKTVKKDDKRLPQATKKSKLVKKKERKHPEYGTSKLEEKFAKNFLDKLGVKYTYQFKAESIGRYYDFYLPDNNILIEVDGDYYHSKGLLYENMSPMQKHNYRVDKQKDLWALSHGIPLIRIWESDINNNPEKVTKILKENIIIYTEKHLKDIEKNKRH